MGGALVASAVAGVVGAAGAAPAGKACATWAAFCWGAICLGGTKPRRMPLLRWRLRMKLRERWLVVARGRRGRRGRRCMLV